MDHADYSLRSAVTFFFFFLSLFSRMLLLKGMKFGLLAALAPLPLLLGVFPVLGI